MAEKYSHTTIRLPASIVEELKTDEGKERVYSAVALGCATALNLDAQGIIEAHGKKQGGNYVQTKIPLGAVMKRQLKMIASKTGKNSSFSFRACLKLGERVDSNKLILCLDGRGRTMFTLSNAVNAGLMRNDGKNRGDLARSAIIHGLRKMETCEDFDAGKISLTAWEAGGGKRLNMALYPVQLKRAANVAIRTNVPIKTVLRASILVGLKEQGIL